jgi:hypothetical protein
MSERKKAKMNGNGSIDGACSVSATSNCAKYRCLYTRKIELLFSTKLTRSIYQFNNAPMADLPTFIPI